MKKYFLGILALVMVLALVAGTTNTATAAKPVKVYVTLTSYTMTTVYFDFEWNKVKDVAKYQFKLWKQTIPYQVAGDSGPIVFNWDSKKPSSNSGSYELSFTGIHPIQSESYTVEMTLYDASDGVIGVYYSSEGFVPYP